MFANRNLRKKIYYVSRLKHKESPLSNANLYNSVNIKTLSFYLLESLRKQLKKVGYASLAFGSYYLYSNRNTLQSKFIDYFQTPAKTYIKHVLSSKEVKGEGLRLLEKIFKEKLLHETLLILLKTTIKEKTFVNESKIFGKKLIREVIKEKDFKLETKELSIKTFKSKEIKDESVQILKFLIDDSQAKLDVKMYMEYVWLRVDTLTKLNHLFMKSAIRALNSEQFKSNSTIFFCNITQDSEFKWNMINKAIPRIGYKKEKLPNNYLVKY